MLRPFTILLSLFVGLVVTVVLVALLARWPLYPYDARYFVDQPLSTIATAQWTERAPPKWRPVKPQLKIWESRGGTHLWIAAGPDAFSRSDHPLPTYRPSLFEIHVAQYGWPFRCGYSEWWDEWVDGNPGVSGENCLRLGGHVFPSRIMPLGFLANVLTLGAGSWFVAAIALCVRRNVRLRAGKCPHCAYRLGDAIGDGCPECGWAREADDEGSPSATT